MEDTGVDKRISTTGPAKLQNDYERMIGKMRHKPLRKILVADGK
jgi:hypothetical protein